MKHLAFDCRLWQANWHGSYKEKTTVSTLSVKPRISIKCQAYYTIFYYEYMKKKCFSHGNNGQLELIKWGTTEQKSRHNNFSQLRSRLAF